MDDRAKGTIKAKADITWSTWRDIISFEIQRLDPEKTLVVVSSQPAKEQLVDYGKNLDNIETMLAFLKAQAPGGKDL